MSEQENKILETLRLLIVDKLQVSPEEIELDSHFITDLQADSLDIVDLVMGIEEEFDLSIEDVHAERILTVQNAVDYILEHADHKS
jgi:acyl carrier protein